MRVLITQVIPGPFCGLLLADLGAEVIKVEKPGGDDSRRMAPPTIQGESAAFMAINRNKRGLGLNLRLRKAENFSESWPRELMSSSRTFGRARWTTSGSATPTFRPRPALIYCSISGFGQTGPYRERGGFDLVAQAMRLMSITGHADQSPVKVGVPIADSNAGFYACYRHPRSLHPPVEDGGQHIDTSLLEAGLAYTFLGVIHLFCDRGQPATDGFRTSPFGALSSRACRRWLPRFGRGQSESVGASLRGYRSERLACRRALCEQRRANTASAGTGRHTRSRFCHQGCRGVAS